MKKLLCILLLVTAMARGADSQIISALKRDASRCADLWNKEDYRSFADLIADRALPAGFSREKFADVIKQEMKGILAWAGMQNLRVSIGEVGKIQQAAGLSTSIIRIQAVLNGKDGKITAPDSILGISNDDGKSWKFIILYKMRQEDLNDLFPEFKGKLEIPFVSPWDVKLEINGAPPRTMGPP